MLQFFNTPDYILYLLCLLYPILQTILTAPAIIRMLRSLKNLQPIRQTSAGVLAPDHQSKIGTPTMGGIMIIDSILLGVLFFTDLSNPLIHCFLIVTVVTSFLGLLDDSAKITKRNTDGVSGWFKIGLQAIASLAVGCYLHFSCGYSSLNIPFLGSMELGLLYIPFVMLVIIGSSNAVNLTDGLDGLASGNMTIAALAFAAISFISATHGGSPVAGFTDMTFCCLLIASACMGFLIFNCNPAQIFMGDTGSLALGGALGTIAVCLQQEFLLIIIGGIFVLEALSVMLQVSWFKCTRKIYGEGRRLFRMAPIHHHFEKGGWKETQVCVRFWIIGFFLAVVGMALFLLDKPF